MVTEAALKQIRTDERKRKQKWMTEDILDLRKKRRQVKNNREKCEILHMKIRIKMIRSQTGLDQ